MDSGALVLLIMKRFVAMIGILIVLAAVVFMLERFTPADPVHVMVGANASPATIAAARHQLGYDKPVPQQFLSYLGGLAHGDLEMSLRTRRPVTTDLGDYLPATIELAMYGLILAIVIGGTLGLATALRLRGSGIVRFLLLGVASAPPFLLAICCILLFYRRLGWLPATGRSSIENAPSGPTKLLTVDGLLHGRWDVVTDAFRHLVLPAFCVAIVPAVAIGRVLRSSLVGTMGSDHVRTARAKGLRESTVVGRHAVRNSIGPALSMTGLQVGLMFAGVIVVEEVFAWPGIGLYTAQSIPRTDFPAIAGVTLVLGAVYVIVNALVDVGQAIADPRIAMR
jgi:peptide/nickel transport system permease protein